MYIIFNSVENDEFKYHKSNFVSVVVLITLTLLAPSRNTIIQMYVASKVTPATINMVVEKGKDFKEEIKKDIIDIIISVEKCERGKDER